MGDLTHWNLVPDFSAHEAAALATGVEPDECRLDAFTGRRSGPPGYRVVLDAMERAYKEALHAVFVSRTCPFGDGDPSDARKAFEGFEGPHLLGSIGLSGEITRILNDQDSPIDWDSLTSPYDDLHEQRFARAELDRWFRANGAGFVPIYQFATDGVPEPAHAYKKPDELHNAQARERADLTTRERDTLLRILYGMARALPYEFDPSAQRNEATATIASATAAAGCNVDVDTVRKYLKEAAEKFGPTRR